MITINKQFNIFSYSLPHHFYSFKIISATQKTDFHFYN